MIRGPLELPIAIAACALELVAGATEIQLLPAGSFRAHDGRPTDAPAWLINAQLAQALIDKVAARKSALVIDYEHQSLHADKSGQPAPAAGWFRELVWREGKGLYAIGVEWTERARIMIAAREYRYISPVFRYNKNTGAVTELLMAAVTNTPGIDGMVGLDERAAARFSLANGTRDSGLGTRNHMTETLSMNNAHLKALGLKDGAGDDDVTQAIEALQAKTKKLGETETALRQAQEAALRSAHSAGSGQAVDKPDPAKFVPVASVTALQAEVAALTSKINQTEVDSLIEGALAAGKLLPAMETWARDLGQQDVAMLKRHLDAAVAVAALTGTQTGGKAPTARDGALDAEQLAMCRAMGLSADDYKAALQAEAA